MTCCFFSSLKTLLMPTSLSSPELMSRTSLFNGRFSGGHQWPVLSGPRGYARVVVSGRSVANALSAIAYHIWDLLEFVDGDKKVWKLEQQLANIARSDQPI